MTFGGVSRKILSKLCALKSQRIDIVFDSLQSLSIKDYEIDSRAASLDRTLNFQILGESQRRPDDFRQALRNNAFKDALIGAAHMKRQIAACFSTCTHYQIANKVW